LFINVKGSAWTSWAVFRDSIVCGLQQAV